MTSKDDKYLLKTDRLTLSVITSQDLQFVFEALSNKTVTKFYEVSFSTTGETKAQIKWYEELLVQKTGIWWKLTDIKTGEKMGACGFNDWDQNLKKAEIGFWLLPEYWKKGFMSEAVVEALKYGFNEMKLEIVGAEVESGNSGSIDLLKKMNFKKRAGKSFHEMKNGKEITVDVFELVRPDFH